MSCWSASISGDERAKEHKSECGHFEASEKAGLLRQTYRAACEPNRAGDRHDTLEIGYRIVPFVKKKDTVEHDIKISNNLGKSFFKNEFIRIFKGRLTG